MNDSEEQRRNRLRDAEAAAGIATAQDPFASYASHGMDPQTPMTDNKSPFMSGAYGDPFGQSSSAALPLVSHAQPQPFARGDMYEREFDEGKSMRSEDFDGGSRYTAPDLESNYGTESYAPSRNMFQNLDTKAALHKDPLPGEILEGEVTEELKDTPARRKWVALCWSLTWWLPSPLLRTVGRMSRLDIRQAWREKLAINMLIWFICGCAVFVIAVMGDLICPREYVFNSGEVSDHTFNNSPDHTYVTIRGEVFDLTGITKAHGVAVPVVPSKLVTKYGGTDASGLFPVQVCLSRLVSSQRQELR